MRLGNRRKPVSYCDSAIPSGTVCQLRIPVEEEEVGIKQLAVLAKHPHKELHRPDIDQEPNMRANRADHHY